MWYVKAPAELLRLAEGVAASYNINTYAISEDVYCLPYSNAANAILASAFGVSFLLHVWQGTRSKCWTFLFVMAVGGFLETVGYVIRALLRDDLFCRTYMPAQLVALSVAPTYLAFGIYIILNHILTYTLGAKPQTHIWAFTINAIISAILQASPTLAASTTNRVTMADSVKLAGFISQIYMLSILARMLRDFAAILCDVESLESTFNSCTEVRKLFIPVAIASAAFCIRSLYRTADLVFDYSYPLVHIEALFVNLEGCMCLTIMLAFNFFHPGSALSQESGEYLELPSVDKQEEFHA